MLVRIQRRDALAGLVPRPAVAARLLAHANVEPYRGIEARLLGQHEVSQVIAEGLHVGL